MLQKRNNFVLRNVYYKKYNFEMRVVTVFNLQASYLCAKSSVMHSERTAKL